VLVVVVGLLSWEWNLKIEDQKQRIIPKRRQTGGGGGGGADIWSGDFMITARSRLLFWCRSFSGMSSFHLICFYVHACLLLFISSNPSVLSNPIFLNPLHRISPCFEKKNVVIF
jgi:hypothetical protein